jgi:hypothetical protein
VGDAVVAAVEQDQQELVPEAAPGEQGQVAQYLLNFL